jgi:hypothetical protein
MEDEEVNEFYDENRKRRVIILRRDNGSFYYEEEYFSEYPEEMCWLPKAGQMTGLYESQERAEKEAQANIGWLRNL